MCGHVARGAGVDSGTMQGPPWQAARKAADEAGVAVAPLRELSEADQVLQVMEATWGERQVIPRELLRALQASGNVLYGAFDGPRLVGFVLGFYGPRTGYPGPGPPAGEDESASFHLHSHMLAVLPGWRSRGVGYALKLAQRAAALDAGVTEVRWTFDPLLARNARFNLRRLGALADRFHREFYGEMEDALNRGDRSDRLEASWMLHGRPGGQAAPPAEAEAILEREGPPDAPRPGPVRSPSASSCLVWIPADYPELRGRAPGLAADWREASARAFEACLEAGMVAVDFLDGSAYLFQRSSLVSLGVPGRAGDG